VFSVYVIRSESLGRTACSVMNNCDIDISFQLDTASVAARSSGSALPSTQPGRPLGPGRAGARSLPSYRTENRQPFVTDPETRDVSHTARPL